MPGKSNALHKHHEHSHYCFAQVGYVSEFCAALTEECQQFSCDDMNKLNVGILAVSRYHQLSRFFPIQDAPNYFDHDFPYRNSKIIPCGYMMLHNGSQKAPGGTPMCARSESPTRCYSKQRDRRRSHSVPAKQRGKCSVGQFTRDRLGRLHYKVPLTGPLYMFNQASKFHSATVTCHISDISTLLP